MSTIRPTWVEVFDAPPNTTGDDLLRLPYDGSTEEVWVIDARCRSMQVWFAQGMTTLSDTQTLTTALLPGFSVAVHYLLDG
jgi:hypothetical protein